jgi:hypothetical protein
VDLPVKPLVGPRQYLGTVDELPILTHHLPEHADFLRRRMLRGKPGGEPFEFRADDVELAQLPGVEGRDDEASPVAGEHRLGLEPLQCFADGRARHAESLRELRLDQPVAWSEFSPVDRFQNEVVGVGVVLRCMRHAGKFIGSCETVNKIGEGVRRASVLRSEPTNVQVLEAGNRLI